MLGNTVTIVGAGPVGTLAAIYFAKEGWDVMLFDLRNGASIYLSISP